MLAKTKEAEELLWLESDSNSFQVSLTAEDQ